MTKETARVFGVDGQLHRPSTNKADRAFFDLLEACSQSDLGILLANMTTMWGLEAFEILQERCCPQDPAAQRQARNNLEFAVIQPAESVS